MQYPAPLKPGSTIAITAFSSGVPQACHARLDIIISALKALGFQVIQGECLRQDIQHVSAPKKERAEELMTFLCDDSIDAVIPPWGGEFAMELLPLLDFDKLSSVSPKWVVGFSDVSTIMMALTTRLGWGTAHAANLLQLHPNESEPLTANLLGWLGLEPSQSFTQHSSANFESMGESFADNPHALLNCKIPTCWKILGEDEQVTFSGRLIGGCFDTLTHIIGTEHFDLDRYAASVKEEGVILYLENAEMSPTVLKRALLSLKFKGVFDVINGLLIGRNAVMDNGGKAISGLDASIDVLTDVDIPIVYDVDIGHLPPNLTLVNGALANVTVKSGKGVVTQSLT
ncbi:S66 peptidase family protein [Vibrio profundi]|uniref:S66 family peptidase n=1 Tax=Vibrio profundi TaxID=1774960 RepID=UPI0037363AE7